MLIELRNTSTWLRALSYLAALGLFIGGVGWALDVNWLLFFGIALSAPLILGGVVSVLFVPYAAWVVAKEKQNEPVKVKDPEDPKDSARE